MPQQEVDVATGNVICSFSSTLLPFFFCILIKICVCPATGEAEAEAKARHPDRS